MDEKGESLMIDEAEHKRSVRDAVVAHFDSACEKRHERSNTLANRALELAERVDREMAMLVGDHKQSGRVGTIERDITAAHDGLRAMRTELASGLEKITNKLDMRFDGLNREIVKITIKVAAGFGAAAVAAKMLGLV